MHRLNKNGKQLVNWSELWPNLMWFEAHRHGILTMKNCFCFDIRPKCAQKRTVQLQQLQNQDAHFFQIPLHAIVSVERQATSWRGSVTNWSVDIHSISLFFMFPPTKHAYYYVPSLCNKATKKETRGKLSVVDLISDAALGSLLKNCQ